MKLHLVLSAASLAVAVVLPDQPSGKVSYDGYKMLHVNVDDLVGFNAVQSMLEGLPDAITIQSCTNHRDHLDVAIPAHSLNAFDALNLTSHVIHEDLGAAIAEEGPLVPYEAPESVGALPPASWFSAYHSYADHLTFLTDVHGAFNNSELFVVGKTFEGREINGIHLWGSGGKGTKPAIVFDATVHAREWIATMVIEYILYELVSGYSTDATIKAYIDKYDFYIIPVVNPDGFLYTQTNERLWRKNRQTRTGITPVGTDNNRNWPYKWAVPGGASTSPSADDYKGQAAGDTPEIQAFTAWFATIVKSQEIRWYIDFHSYSKAILLPYGYSCTAKVSNLAAQQSLANGMKSSISAVRGTSFEAGPICTTLYEATGGSTDYLQDITKVEFAWAIELQGTSFVLPPAQILPSSEEVWAGVKSVMNNLPST